MTRTIEQGDSESFQRAQSSAQAISKLVILSGVRQQPNGLEEPPFACNTRTAGNIFTSDRMSETYSPNLKVL